jgi:hypothetical protein
MEQINRLIDAEIVRQDTGCRGGYVATRDGLRMAIAHLEDEVREAREAHREERHDDYWVHTSEELVQVAAIAVRALRAMCDDDLPAVDET